MVKQEAKFSVSYRGKTFNDLSEEDALKMDTILTRYDTLLTTMSEEQRKRVANLFKYQWWSRDGLEDQEEYIKEGKLDDEDFWRIYNFSGLADDFSPIPKYAVIEERKRGLLNLGDTLDSLENNIIDDYMDGTEFFIVDLDTGKEIPYNIEIKVVWEE